MKRSTIRRSFSVLMIVIMVIGSVACSREEEAGEPQAKYSYTPAYAAGDESKAEGVVIDSAFGNLVFEQIGEMIDTQPDVAGAADASLSGQVLITNSPYLEMMLIGYILSAREEAKNTETVQEASKSGFDMFTEVASRDVTADEDDADFGNTGLIQDGNLAAGGDEEGTDPDADTVDVDEIDVSEIQFLDIYRVGVSDRSVAYIQQRLMDLGFMDSSEPTEYFGNMTSEAVKLFQRQNELKQDGVIGSESIAMLLNPDAKSYMVVKGMEGKDIKNIQTRLYELGYLASKDLIDGKFGDDTVAAVKALQSANALSVDGKIGTMTMELLYSEEIKANILSFGDKSEIIKTCQQRLKELGYLTTTPDGSYGNDTLAAVKLFQSKNNLVVDGFLGPSTREVLEGSAAIANGLVIGDEGDTVKRVQELLIKYGYMKEGGASGYFGEVTENAVKDFQRNNGLFVDGDVGAKTMAKLTGGDAARKGETGGNTGTKEKSGSDDSGTVDTGSTYSGSVSNLLKVAKSKLGCKYVYGSKGPNTFDCSGFVHWCLNQVGVKQSYITSYGWRSVDKYKKISKFSDLKAGDVIVVRGHVGIVAEDNTVVDASSSSGKIVHRALSSWWKNSFVCGWRIFD